MNNLIVNPYINEPIPRSTFCRKCGHDYTSPKFGGSIVIANPHGGSTPEIIFCTKCSNTFEAGEIYNDLMGNKRIIHAL